MNVSFPKCNQAGTEFVISTTDDLQEKVNYLSEDFPVAIFTQTYHHAASDSTPFHWHNELQLNWVSEGELEYSQSSGRVTSSNLNNYPPLTPPYTRGETAW